MNKADTKRKMVPWEQYDAIVNEAPDLFTACLILAERCREKDAKIVQLEGFLNPKPEVAPNGI